jgi:hypothetical protein
VRRDPRTPEVTEVPEADDQAAQAAGRLAGPLFGAVTILPALLAAAWLLPGLPLLLAGRLSAPPMMFMFSPLAAGLCYVAMRQLPASWPGFRVSNGATAPVPAARRRRQAASSVPWWAVAATIAVAAGFAAWQIAERTQQVIYVQDPATYLQAAYWIAHHGSLPIPDSPQAFGGADPGLSFATLSYSPVSGGLAPQLMTGIPLVLAAAVWLGGVPAALVTTPLLGACAVLSFGGLAGRLVGTRWAPAAAAALALTLPEQYTSRGTFSEPLVQVLLFGGLCLLTDSLVIARRPAAPAAGVAAAPAPAGGPAAWLGQDAVLAALGGLVLGLTVLIRIDALSDILPAIPFLGVLLAARRPQGIPFALGLLTGVAYGLADGYLPARAYLQLEAPSLRPLGLITVATGLLTLAGLAVAWNGTARARMRGWLAAKRDLAVRWLPDAAAVVVVAIFIWFACLPLVGAQRSYQDGLYWVTWYIGLPAVLLGAFGLAILARRCARALLTWQDPGAAARTWALPLMIALWVTVTVLWRPDAAAGQPWASRQLVSFVLPGLILAAIWAAAWLRALVGQRGRARVTSAAVSACCVASLLIPAAVTNLDVGRSLSAQGMAFRRIGAGEVGAAGQLCAAIGPDASVVALDSLTADRFAQLVRGMCDTPTAVLDSGATPAAVQAAVLGIERAGRRPVLLARTGTELAPYGGGPREVVNLLTAQEAQVVTSPPTGTRPVLYTVWLSDPVAQFPSA